MKYPAEVKKAISVLEKNGYEAYVVGGCLRNIMMGKEPHDWDMTTSALPHITSAVFKESGAKVIETGLKHGTVTVIINSLPIEITTFRIDGSYTDSRHPDSVDFTTKLSEDLSRRDFTVNAMAYSDRTGTVDLFGGATDLKNNLLRCVGDPATRFQEDALRILRAFRFVSEHGFDIEDGTKNAIKEKKEGLKSISRERICSELIRTFTGSYSAKALMLMYELDLFSCIFDNINDEYFVSPSLFGTLPKNKHLRLALFFSAFPSEALKSALTSLKLSTKDEAAVKKLISGINMLKNFPFDDVFSARRFIRIYGDMTTDVFTLANALKADVRCSEEAVKDALEEDFPKSISELAVDGATIMSLGARGKEIGIIIDALMEKTLIEPSLNKKEALLEEAKKIISEFEK